MPQLSIITINYNDAEGLRKTIESVVNQTSDDFEYIVIDGGSTDGSVEVIREFENKIDQWVSESDKGIYNAMNKGIARAKGEYCQFLNSGDILAGKDVIRQCLLKLKGASIYYGNMLKELKNGTIFYSRKIPQITFLTFYHGTINHSSAIIKISLFEKYGYYDENLKVVSDWKFFLQVVGLNNEQVKYFDIDVSIFDMSGISNTNLSLDRKERRETLEELVPSLILADYDRHWKDIMQMKRMKRYWLFRKSIHFFERLIFKIDKRKTNKRKEHLYY